MSQAGVRRGRREKGQSRPTCSSPSQHKLCSSNVNINETNELSVMSVMTVDCSRNKRTVSPPDSALPLSRLELRCALLYRATCILAKPWQWDWFPRQTVPGVRRFLM